MFDINALINTAITEAVTQQFTTLQQEYANKIGEMAVKISELETKLAEAALFDRTTSVTIPIDEAKMVEALNSQEWFWEKLRTKVDDIVDKAMEDHTSTYNHDDYDDASRQISDIDPDDFIRSDDLTDAVRDVLGDVRVRLEL